MSALLTLDRLSLTAPDGRPLFVDLTLAVGRERVGLVGRNGAGKSTLLRAIMGDVPPHAGHIAAAGSVAVLDQSLVPDITAADALGIAAAQARLDRIERGAGDEADFAAADWSLPERLADALEHVGLGAVELDRPIAGFSGGERMRLAFARLMLDGADLALLDEPSNNLDAAGQALLASLIAGWRGGMVIASHDRALLERVDRIVELSPVRVLQVGGGWSAFAAVRDAERAQAADAAEQADAALRGARREAQAARERQARRDAGGRAHAASGSAPRIAIGLAKRRAEATAGAVAGRARETIADAAEQREAARAALERDRALAFTLPATHLPAGRTVLTLDRVTIAHRGRSLFAPLSLTIRGPERIALAGPNGSGKSSVMRLIAQGEDTRVMLPVPAAMLDQHVSLIDAAGTLIDAVRRHQPGIDDNAAHAALARFGFRNREALRAPATLSGGERLRAGLACIMGGAPPSLLLLDEPTNHLDLDAVTALEAALRDFDGALLVVSHDAAFLDAIGIARKITLAPPP